MIVKEDIIKLFDTINISGDMIKVYNKTDWCYDTFYDVTIPINDGVDLPIKSKYILVDSIKCIGSNIIITFWLNYNWFYMNKFKEEIRNIQKLLHNFKLDDAKIELKKLETLDSNLTFLKFYEDLERKLYFLQA